MKFIILIIVSQIFLSSAEYTSDRPCPDRPVMQNFDITKISGRWYNVMQYEDVYASSFLCGHGNYSVIDDNSLKVHECELQNRKYVCLTGIISLLDPKKNPKEGQTGYAYIDNPNNIIDEFKNLSVDYDDHAVVYNCKNIEGNKSVHALWIASRSPKLSANGKVMVDALIGEYFDRTAVKNVEQSSELCDPRMQ